MDNQAQQLIDEIRILAGHEDAGGALARVCALLRSRVDHYDWVGYYVAVPSERLLLLGPFEGAPTEHLRIPYGTGICGQAAFSEAWFSVPDVRAAENYLACSLETRAEVVVPVFADGRFVGELDIDSHTVDPFTAFDDELLNAVAEITAPLVATLVPEDGYTPGESERNRTR
ncbi:MAG: GAF domain-containing protein [Spirochaetota bacterium]